MGSSNSTLELIARRENKFYYQLYSIYHSCVTFGNFQAYYAMIVTESWAIERKNDIASHASFSSKSPAVSRLGEPRRPMCRVSSSMTVWDIVINMHPSIAFVIEGTLKSAKASPSNICPKECQSRPPWLSSKLCPLQPPSMRASIGS